METREEKNGRDGGEIGEERIFEPLAEVQGFAGGAEAAEESADVGILPEFEDSDGAENKGDRKPEQPSHGGAPLDLAFLKAFEFLDHVGGALDLGRRA